MWSELRQRNGMNVGNHRFIKHILHGAALGFSARHNMRVGIRNNLEFAGGKKLGRNIVAITEPGLLRREALEKIYRLFFAHAAFQVYVPLGILEIDANFAAPFWGEQVFILFWSFARTDQLGVIGHGVEKGMNVDPVTFGIFKPFVVGGASAETNFWVSPDSFKSSS